MQLPCWGAVCYTNCESVRIDVFLRQGSRLHVLSAAYSPATPDEHRLEATAEALYLMMGRGLERLPVQSALHASRVNMRNNTG